MTNVFILTVYDGADFDTVLHHGAYATYDRAMEAGEAHVKGYDDTMAETEHNRIFVGSCRYDITNLQVIS